MCCRYAVDTVVCAPDDGWRYHPEHVEQFPDKINCVTLYLVGYILEYPTRILNLGLFVCVNFFLRSVYPQWLKISTYFLSMPLPTFKILD